MFHLNYNWELPPIGLGMSGCIEETIHQCARGESTPDLALMRLLVASCSEEETERMLGAAIWDALEGRNAPTAERLGAMQKLWDGAKDLVQSVVQQTGPMAVNRPDSIAGHSLDR